MGALIEALLAFSRLSRQSLNRGPVNTTAMVEECVREARGDSQARVTVGPLPQMNADPTLLRQVWLNLLANAFKYSKHTANALVEVGATTTDSGQTCFFVRDNGVGFDMAHAGKLFGVFQRLHRNDEFEGTGVGLAIVERIVTRHGGQVSAQAQVGLGATFSFTLGESDE
jgi:light-regulated signal transduction histidine kinase (bacteriophytochrome)